MNHLPPKNYLTPSVSIYIIIFGYEPMLDYKAIGKRIKYFRKAEI